MKRIGFALATTVVVIASARGARADVSEAQKLFDEARALVENGRWAEACPRLAESMRLEPNMTTQFRLADCYEKTGRTASAWANYVGAAKAAAAAGAADKERFASERAAKLAPHVDKLVLVVQDAPDLAIERDGRTIPRDEWARPLPLDPGEHTLHAWAPGKASFDVLITATGAGELHKVEVPALEPALPWRLSEEANPKTLSVAPSLPPSAAGDRAEPRAAASPWRTVGWTLGAIGLAATAVGAGVYIGEMTRTDPCAGARCVPTVTVVGAGALVTVAGAILVAATSR